MTFPGVDENLVAGAVVPPPTASATPANPYALKAWGSKFSHVEFDVECPSGQRCRARQLQMEDALALGVLDSLDMFTPAVMNGIGDDSTGKQQEDSNTAILGGLSDPEKRNNFFGTVNKVLAHTVVIPRVALVDDGNLPEGTVFANDIPFADKMHIFRAVFSARGDALQSFREGQEGDVAPVEAESGVPLPTQ